jgi:hypothetical protein
LISIKSREAAWRQTATKREAVLTQLCAELLCQCKSVLLRTYNELRIAGYDDRNAFHAATHVLTLRHPGHAQNYYSGLAAQWIEAAAATEPMSDKVNN